MRELSMRKRSGSGRLSSNGTDIGRRTILKSAALVVGAGAAMQSCNSAGNAPSASASYEVGDSSVIVRAGTAVVGTESGMIAGARPYELRSRIASGSVRQSAVEQATAKAALNGAPAHLYWFAWQTPVFDGRPQAFHCAELPFRRSA
jgi:hypothetical protein